MRDFTSLIDDKFFGKDPQTGLPGIFLGEAVIKYKDRGVEFLYHMFPQVDKSTINNFVCCAFGLKPTKVFFVVTERLPYIMYSELFGERLPKNKATTVTNIQSTQYLYRIRNITTRILKPLVWRCGTNKVHRVTWTFLNGREGLEHVQAQYCPLYIDILETLKYFIARPKSIDVCKKTGHYIYEDGAENFCIANFIPRINGAFPVDTIPITTTVLFRHKQVSVVHIAYIIESEFKMTHIEPLHKRVEISHTESELRFIVMFETYTTASVKIICMGVLSLEERQTLDAIYKYIATNKGLSRWEHTAINPNHVLNKSPQIHKEYKPPRPKKTRNRDEKTILWGFRYEIRDGALHAQLRREPLLNIYPQCYRTYLEYLKYEARHMVPCFKNRIRLGAEFDPKDPFVYVNTYSKLPAIVTDTVRGYVYYKSHAIENTDPNDKHSYKFFKVSISTHGVRYRLETQALIDLYSYDDLLEYGILHIGFLLMLLRNKYPNAFILVYTWNDTSILLDLISSARINRGLTCPPSNSTKVVDVVPLFVLGHDTKIKTNVRLFPNVCRTVCVDAIRWILDKMDKLMYYRELDSSDDEDESPQDLLKRRREAVTRQPPVPVPFVAWLYILHPRSEYYGAVTTFRQMESHTNLSLPTDMIIEYDDVCDNACFVQYRLKSCMLTIGRGEQFINYVITSGCAVGTQIVELISIEELLLFKIARREAWGLNIFITVLTHCREALICQYKLYKTFIRYMYNNNVIVSGYGGHSNYNFVEWQPTCSLTLLFISHFFYSLYTYPAYDKHTCNRILNKLTIQALQKYTRKYESTNTVGRNITALCINHLITRVKSIMDTQNDWGDGVHTTQIPEFIARVSAPPINGTTITRNAVIDNVVDNTKLKSTKTTSSNYIRRHHDREGGGGGGSSSPREQYAIKSLQEYMSSVKLLQIHSLMDQTQTFEAGQNTVEGAAGVFATASKCRARQQNEKRPNPDNIECPIFGTCIPLIPILNIQQQQHM
jgi:hypothetical protein